MSSFIDRIPRRLALGLCAATMVVSGLAFALLTAGRVVSALVPVARECGVVSNE